jgi:hypothetical protein
MRNLALHKKAMKRKRYIVSAIVLVLAVVFGWFFFYSIEKGNKDVCKDAIANQFSGVVSKKWMERGLNIRLSNGSDLSRYILDTGMNSVEVGDSIRKNKGENICTIFKKDGKVLNVKFIYLQPE